VRQLEVIGERSCLDGKGVILGGDLDLAGHEIADRVVRAVVPEGHLVGLGSEHDGKHLVRQADAKDRLLAHQVGKRILGHLRSFQGPSLSCASILPLTGRLTAPTST